MVQKVHKFGNSLAVVIPSAENKMHRIEPGTMVEVTETADGWHVRPVKVIPLLSEELKQIANDVTENRAAVMDALAR